MRGTYNFTRSGVKNAEQHSITPVEVWEVIDSGGRLFHQVSDNSMIVLGETLAGRPLMVLVTAAEREPDSWNIVATRELWDTEIISYRKALGGNDG